METSRQWLGSIPLIAMVTVMVMVMVMAVVMTVTVTVAVTVAVVVMVIRSRPWNTKFCFLAHSDSLAGAGSMSNKSASGFRRPARRFPARGWVLAEQTCIARGSPVHPKLACVEMPFPLGVLQDGDRTAKACTAPIHTLQR